MNTNINHNPPRWQDEALGDSMPDPRREGEADDIATVVEAYLRNDLGLSWGLVRENINLSLQNEALGLAGEIDYAETLASSWDDMAQAVERREEAGELARGELDSSEIRAESTRVLEDSREAVESKAGKLGKVLRNVRWMATRPSTWSSVDRAVYQSEISTPRFELYSQIADHGDRYLSRATFEALGVLDLKVDVPGSVSSLASRSEETNYGAGFLIDQHEAAQASYRASLLTERAAEAKRAEDSRVDFARQHQPISSRDGQSGSLRKANEVLNEFLGTRRDLAALAAQAEATQTRLRENFEAAMVEMAQLDEAALDDAALDEMSAVQPVVKPAVIVPRISRYETPTSDGADNDQPHFG